MDQERPPAADGGSPQVSRRGLIQVGSAAAILVALGLDSLIPTAAQANPAWRHPFTSKGTVPAGGHFGSWVLSDGSPRQYQHTGLDYSPPTSGPIFSVAAGEVSEVDSSASWGNYVYIDHANGYRSAYAHMEPGSVQLDVGQSVPVSEYVGDVGGTGNPLTGRHLHLVIRHNGTLIDPYPLVHNAPLAQPGVGTTNRQGEPPMLMIMKGTAPSYTFALFAADFWYEWTGDGGGVANSFLLQIAGGTPGAGVKVSSAEWNAIKAEATRVRTVAVAP
jgi:hypothetical protein